MGFGVLAGAELGHDKSRSGNLPHFIHCGP